VLGRQLELIIEDNKSDPAETRSAAEKLIVRDKVPVIIGAWGSLDDAGHDAAGRQHHVGIVVETSELGEDHGSQDAGLQGGQPHQPTSELEAIGAEPLHAQARLKKVGYLAVNTDWGRGAVVRLGERVKKQGGTVERSSTWARPTPTSTRS
jgi:branched-chain amino acid transport system substrate-binding protein